jgi:hypothetical protein
MTLVTVDAAMQGFMGVAVIAAGDATRLPLPDLGVIPGCGH